MQAHLPQIAHTRGQRTLQLRFRFALLAMRFWAAVEAFAQRRYRISQAHALHYKRRLDVRAALATACRR